MAPGGRAIFPQEPYRAHSDYLLPARPVVLWYYTDMQDPRWIWGKKYIHLKQDKNMTNPQIIGLMNKQEWAAYVLNGQTFIKWAKFDEKATYPDYGCNFEAFTNADMLEMETLGPLTKLPPSESVQHVEKWSLHKVSPTEDEDSIDKLLLPLVTKKQLN